MRFVSVLVFACGALAARDVSFEPNKGQAGKTYAFVGRASSTAFALNADGFAVAGRGRQSVSVLLEGSRRGARAVPEQPLPGVRHYVRGSDPRGWLWNIPAYSRVRFREVQPGIDVVYGGRDKELELNFELAPGAEPRNIRLRFSGEVRLSRDGDLLAGGSRFRRPEAWQEREGRRTRVPVAFARIDSRRVAFRLGTYDRRLPLTIDPVIEFATYLGGSDDEGDTRVAAAADGGILVAGTTASVDFPEAQFSGAPFNRPIQMLSSDAYIAKVTGDASAIQWALFFGGSAGDAVDALETDGRGGVYLLGHTSSTNLPVTQGAFKTHIHSSLSDLFVAKFDAESGRLLYSTYLNVHPLSGARLTVDRLGSAYVGCVTDRTASTTLGAFRTSPSSDYGGSYVLRLNPAGSAPIYATYFDLGSTTVMRADSDGSLLVGGSTKVRPFPSVNPIPGQQLPESAFEGGYIARLNAGGTATPFASILTGSGRYGGVLDLRIEPGGNIHVLGYASGRDFDQVNPLKLESSTPTEPDSNYDSSPFLVKLAPEGSRFLQSTYFRTAEYTRPDGQPYNPDQHLVLLRNGVPCIVGVGRPPLTQTPGALLPVLNYPVGTSLVCVDDAQQGLALKTWLPYPGGSYLAVALAPDESLIFAGTTSSLSTTPGVFQPRPGGRPPEPNVYVRTLGYDAFLLRLSLTNPRPRVDAVEPQTVLKDGWSGVELQLLGSGFAYGARVELDGKPVDSSVKAWDRITANIPLLQQPVGPARITVSLPGPGGGVSDPRAINIVNAAPTDIYVTPTSVVAGSGETKVAVMATGLGPDSVMRWNGQVRAARYVERTGSTRGYFDLILPAAELSQPSVSEITITNPPPGGGTSPIARFVVARAAGNPIPSLAAPSILALDGPGEVGPSLTFSGSGLTENTKAYWDGQLVPSRYSAPGRILIDPPARDLVSPGVHQLYVTEGGFNSDTIWVALSRTASGPTVADLARRRLYALNASDLNLPSDLLVFDLDRLEPIAKIEAGLRAAAIDVSSDGAYVYVLVPPAKVRRYNAESGAFDREYDLAQSSPLPPATTTVEGLRCLPGAPPSFIALLSQGNTRWLAIFDDGAPRGTNSLDMGLAGGPPPAFVTQSHAIMVPGPLQSSYVEYDGTGITGGSMTQDRETPGVVRDNGLTYLRDGQRILALSFLSLTSGTTRPALAADPDKRRVYVIETDGSGQNTVQVSAFDLDTLERQVIAGWRQQIWSGDGSSPVKTFQLTGPDQAFVQIGSSLLLVPLNTR